jgi:uncharacterized protein (DUF111 family)
VLVGDAASAPQWALTDMCRIDATIDDLDPRLWPDVLEALRGAGAADAWCTPALMRKGRPGQVLSVLAEPDRLDVVCRVMFEQTTTLGVRISSVQRRSLSRDEVSVPVAGEVISVKRGRLGDRVVTVQPEYDDVRAAAARTGRPVADLLAEAGAAARFQGTTEASESPGIGVDGPSTTLHGGAWPVDHTARPRGRPDQPRS